MFIESKGLPPPTDAQLKEARKRFEWLTSFLIIRFKFVHHMLGMMEKIPTPGLGTMGVRVTEEGKFALHYDPVWFLALEEPEVVYIKFHEMVHLSLHHCTRRQLVKIVDMRHPTDEEIYLKRLANYAHDLAVNELIPIIPGVCEPPKDEKGKICGQFVSEYKKQKEFKDIEERQTSEWYFEYLKSKIKQQKGGGGGKGKKGKGGEEAEGLGGDFDDHSGWKEHDMADNRVRVKIKHINDNNLWGDMTQTQKELILAAQVKRINWRNLIKVWFGNLAWKFRLFTRKKPNRRYGWMFPGSKTNYIDRFLVATDTSASVEDELLGQWIGVMNQLTDELPIDVMQFDCEKTSDPQPYDRRLTKFNFTGRGGTNFQPVIDMVDKRRYKGVLILTDGEAAAPTKPKNAQVLWVLPPGHNPPVDWGKRVHLSKYS